MATLFRLFGGFERLVDPISPPTDAVLPPQRARALLAILLLTPGKRWQRQALVRHLFPAEDEAKALARVSDQLYLLRQSCPELQIVSDGGSLSWTGKGIVTDYSLFLQATDETPQLIAAMDLYRGDLLPEFDIDFIDQARESARLQYRTGLVTIASRLELEGRLSEAQDWYQRRLAHDPGDEETLLRYMKNCRELGHRSRGLEAYQNAVRYLTQLSASPGRELKSLALELQAPLSRSRGPLPSAADDELSAVDRAWWLLSESRFKACLDLRRDSESHDPRWELRKLMALEIHGRWRELGEQVRSFLREQSQSPLGLDSQLQALALALLGRAQAEVDSVAEATKSFDKATLLLRQNQSSPSTFGSAVSAFAPAEALLAWIDLQQASLHMRAGSAGTAVEAAKRLLGRLDDASARGSGDWVSVLTLRTTASLGSILLQIGKSFEALGELNRAHALCETWKATEFHHAVSISLASAFDTLGQWDLSGPILEAAAERHLRSSDRFEGGKFLYNWAAHLGNRPDTDLEKACQVANQAIEAFQSVGAEGWEASTYTTLGFVLWQAGQPRQALEAYARARALHTKLGEDLYLTEIHAYEALCHRDLGELELCLEKSLQGVEASLTGGDTAVSADLWTARAECLSAAGQAHLVPGSLTKAAEVLFAEAVDLPDAQTCAALLGRDPLVRLLIARLKEHGLLDSFLERLPASTYLQPHGDDRPSSVALRRHRVREARERLSQKGELPSAARLARIVGASVRTVERDLAVLKKAKSGGVFRSRPPLSRE